MSEEYYIIEDYKILYNKKTPLLEEEVKEYISNGWHPQGGVCIVFNMGAGVAMQAMIKKYYPE